MHLDLDDSVASAGLAAAALYVEAEATLLIAAHLRFIRVRIQIADIVKDARIGSRV